MALLRQAVGVEHGIHVRGVASRNPNDTARGVTALALSKLSEGREGQFFTLGRGRGCEIVKELIDQSSSSQ